MTDKGENGNTVMMAAAKGGAVEAMKFTLANGGGMTDKNSSGHSAMMAAANGGSIEAMKFVLANGGSFADVDSKWPYRHDGGCLWRLRRSHEVHPCKRWHH